MNLKVVSSLNPHLDGKDISKYFMMGIYGDR